MAQWTYGNGRMMNRTQNENGQPGIVQDAAPGGISLGYQFDAVGNLKKLRNGDQNDPPKRLFGYDGLNRLTESKDGANVVQGSYAYDKTGNRTASGRLVTTMGMDCTGVQPGESCTPTGPVSTWTTRTYDYLPNDHRVLTIGNTERHYDAAGNTIWIGPRSIEFVPPPNEDPPPGDPLESAAYAGTEQSAIGLDDGDPPPGITTKTFAYNAANRMASVSEDGNLLMSYRYNGAGERVYRSGSGQTAHTVFDPSGRWLGDYDESGQSLQQAIWLGDLPVGLLARLDGGQRQLFYIQPDALGTPRVVIDPTRGAQGVAVWRWELEDEAFGDTEPNQDPDGDNTLFVLDMRYPGQQHDSATGFNYNYFRDYDASTGRYVQSDPIGLDGGMSTYSYAESNSLISIDRLGLLSEGGIINSTPESCDICTAPRPGGQQSMEAVARIVLKRIYVMSKNKNIEICGLICQDAVSGRFFSAPPTLGSGIACSPSTNRCPRCSKTTGWWHTHGAPEGDKWDAELMSMGDKNTDQSFTHAGAEYWGYAGFTGFLGTPMGVLRYYAASGGGVISGGKL